MTIVRNNLLTYPFCSQYSFYQMKMRCNLSLLSRWEELHALASEPVESHVFLAEHFNDAVNGLYTTLTTFSVCNATPAGGIPPYWFKSSSCV